MDKVVPESDSGTFVQLLFRIFLKMLIGREGSKSKRHRLVNPHYFCSVKTGEGNDEFQTDGMEYL